MSEKKELTTIDEDVLEAKNDFELDDSWLDELDDLDDELEHEKPEQFEQKEAIEQEHDKTNNDFLNKLFEQKTETNAHENSESFLNETNNNETDDDFSGIEIVDIDQIEKEDFNKLDEFVEESQKSKGLNLDDLIKKYEEKYNINSKGQIANPINNANGTNNLHNIEQIINNSSMSEEEKDNRLAQNYVNKLPINDRKVFDNINKPTQKVIVPAVKPTDDDEFSEFREVEQNYKHNSSTRKNVSASTTCKEKIGKFSKISGFSAKYLIFLIGLIIITIGACVYLYIELFTDLLG